MKSNLFSSYGELTFFDKKLLLTHQSLLPDLKNSLIDYYQSGTKQGKILTTIQAITLNHLPGREPVQRLNTCNLNLIKRQYKRGGLLKHYSGYHYLYLGLQKTRVFREFQVIAALHEQGLPVPRPIAFMIERRGFYYRADLITQEIENVLPFSLYLKETFGDAIIWQSIGRMIRQFHAHALDHADLNAHNILINPEKSSCFLIDFDKSRFLPHAEQKKCVRNINRLHRSLLKLYHRNAIFLDLEMNWPFLLDGYYTA